MEYDDIIVGAGSSGAVLAARLSEDPKRSVLLLEAGPDYAAVEQTPTDLLNTWISAGPHDWSMIAQATPTREIAYPRGKVTGGSSAVNGHIALRGTPQDFDEWAAWGNREWSFEQVLPFHRKLEDDRDARGDFHGVGGPIWIQRPRPETGSRSIAPSSRPRVRRDSRKSGTTTIPSPPASARGRATGAKASASRPRSAISRPRAIA